MPDTDLTLSSPLAGSFLEAPALLCLTLLWHPDPRRIGAQVTTSLAQAPIALSRYSPAFQHPGQEEGAALGYGGISRAPLHIEAGDDDGVLLQVPHSRMTVELNGAAIEGEVNLTFSQVAAGAVLGLGGAVLICLHWMHGLPKDNRIAGLAGVGTAAICMRDLILQVAATDTTVLLLGETGCGKDVAARAIHALSRRAQHPMVAVNLATLNEGLASAELFGSAKGAYTGAHSSRPGLFAQANESSLFLDEIGNAPASVQPMLLRVLETGDYRPLGSVQDAHANARLIAATDQNLYQASFNQALLRRLESFVIAVEPLRHRREDIGVLILQLLGEAATMLTFDLVTCIACHDWPGNVRQLKHVLQRCVLALQAGEPADFARMITPHPGHSAAVSGKAATPMALPRKRLAHIDNAAVLAAMQAHAWQISAAAVALGVSRPSMYKLLEGHPDIRRAGQISVDEIRQALAASGQQLEHCAALLKTPCEALRRHLQTLGMPVLY
ncbi:sigma 54-interacting transcriptional regulator [Janthinobacterium sp. RB2R34]|uniref:sigma 54-interacting transcriptional regulator n=1 Tax=Janthinobacterium sp. RB2R34 TaxID=3424193 RepID=UPI003F1FC281